MLAAATGTPNRRRVQAAAITARIGDVLVRSGLIDDLQLRSALAHQDKFGGRICRVLVEMGFASEEAMLSELAPAMSVEVADLLQAPADPAAISKLDADFCQMNGVFPVSLRDSSKTLCVAMAEPNDLELADTIASKTRCRVRELIASEREIMNAIDRHYRHMGRAIPLEEESSLSFRPTPTPKPLSTSTLATTPADLIEQIETLRARLDKATRVIRALVEVGQAKGLFTADDIRAASTRQDR